MNRERAKPLIIETAPLDPLHQLYVAEFGRLVGLAQWLVGSRPIAEELVQETFARLVENPPRLNTPEALSTYVRRALVNRCRSGLRRRALERRHARATIPISVDTPLPDQAIRAAVLALPHRQRQCVALRFYDDLTAPVIARVLGISEGSVKTHLHRGLTTLAVALDEPTPREDTS